MRKLRNIGKMNYHNDGRRTLFESLMNYHVLQAMKLLIAKNDVSEVLLIGKLAACYHGRPVRASCIDILVHDKKGIRFRYFRNNIYRCGVCQTARIVHLLQLYYDYRPSIEFSVSL